MKKAPILYKGKGNKRMLLFRMRRNNIMVDEWAAVQGRRVQCNWDMSKQLSSWDGTRS